MISDLRYLTLEEFELCCPTRSFSNFKPPGAAQLLQNAVDDLIERYIGNPQTADMLDALCADLNKIDRITNATWKGFADKPVFYVRIDGIVHTGKIV